MNRRGTACRSVRPGTPTVGWQHKYLCCHPTVGVPGRTLRHAVPRRFIFRFARHPGVDRQRQSDLWLIGLVCAYGNRRSNAPYLTIAGIHVAVGQSPVWHSQALLGSPPKMRFEPSSKITSRPLKIFRVASRACHPDTVIRLPSRSESLSQPCLRSVLGGYPSIIQRSVFPSL